MIRPLNSLGMGLIVLVLFLGVSRNGRTEENYTVKQGDTLYGIAKVFGVSIEALKKANGLKGDSIHPRQVLTLPPLGEKKADGAAKAPSSLHSHALSAETVKRTSRETDSYVVQKGDCLFSISKKVGLPIEEIKKVNRLPTSALKIGQILLLPTDESQWDDKEGALEEEEEIPESLRREGEKEEPVASAPLGKWNNPEERGLLVRVVRAFLGAPYKLGGSTLKGIDCSAFVRKIYEIFDIQLPRTAHEQFSVGKRVEKGQLEEGDLVFFRGRGNRAHVGIYVGGNQFVHASSYSREVRIDYVDAPYYSHRFLKGVRVKELERES